mmetsp:Transcript_1042/g.2451  ORF Transcript_1042/g.2451 Transcript_1042/m.2451 type:complete len:101 (-) Transcript_1042:67-369(-)
MFFWLGEEVKSPIGVGTAAGRAWRTPRSVAQMAALYVSSTSELPTAGGLRRWHNLSGMMRRRSRVQTLTIWPRVGDLFCENASIAVLPQLVMSMAELQGM